MTWPQIRARYVFRRRDVRGASAPLASATMKGVSLRDDAEHSVWNPGEDVSGYKLVEPNDFVIGLRSFQHGFSFSEIRGLVSPAYTVFRATGDADPRFFKHYFRSRHFILLMDNLAQGIRQGKTIDYEDFSNHPVPLPSLSEQRRIADFLDAETSRIDTLVDAHRRQIALLAERKVEFARRLTTVGPDAQASTQPTAIDWMPEMGVGCALHKVSRVFKTGSGTTPPSAMRQYYEGPVPWINTGDLRDGPVRHPSKSVTRLAVATFPTLRLYGPGSLVVAMYGATIGRLGILTAPAAVNQACCVLHSPSAVATDFAFHWFLAHRAEVVAFGAGGGQPNISQETVRSLRIPAPTLREQEVVVRLIELQTGQSDGLVAAVERQISLLLERRQAVVRLAVTGELDATTARGAA